jgi:hypothetical protein
MAHDSMQARAACYFAMAKKVIFALKDYYENVLLVIGDLDSVN